MKSNHQLAAITRQTVAHLFATGDVRLRADRLVLTIDGPPRRDMGGWCRRAVRDVIRAALEKVNRA